MRPPLDPRRWRTFDWIVVVLFATVVVTAGVTVWWTVKYGLLVRKLRSGVGDTTFYSADGKPWFRMDEQRQDVPLERIAPALRNGVVAVEDHRFYLHMGIDPIGLGRAVVKTATTDSTQGGSTITQQLARTLYLSNQRSIARKAKEAVIALLLEQQLTKDQILELYLNRVYLSAGVYGVEPLSRRLFAKGAKDLSLAESALIAGLIRAPNALSPWSNLDGALDRSHVVLQRMREERYITAQQEQQARRARVRVRAYEVAIEARGGYVKEWLRQQFRNRFGGDHPPDWQARTTVLPEVQDIAEQAVANGLRRIGVRDLQAALVAIDPRSGNIVAMVGGRDFRLTPFNRAARSRRQPGSAFKPIVFAAALERGMSPVSAIRELLPIAVPDADEEWSPRNVRDTEQAVTLRDAIVSSDNRAAVALQQQVGTGAVLALARNVGLDELPDVPSLALGTGLVTPLEMARAYSMFPNGGFDVVPRGITTVLDADGDVALEQDIEQRRVISPQVAFQMTSMLQDVVDRGTGTAIRAWGVRFPAAGKTGTTNDFKDAWFVGYSTELVVAVWVGLDQPATIGRDAFGAKLAAPIWTEFMRRTSQRWRPDRFRPPAGIEDMKLCRVSHAKPLDGCPQYTEVFKKGDARPEELCRLHQGSFRQEARRAVEGAIDVLVDRLKRAVGIGGK